MKHGLDLLIASSHEGASGYADCPSRTRVEYQVFRCAVTNWLLSSAWSTELFLSSLPPWLSFEIASNVVLPTYSDPGARGVSILGL